MTTKTMMTIIIVTVIVIIVVRKLKKASVKSACINAIGRRQHQQQVTNGSKMFSVQAFIIVHNRFSAGSVM